MNIENILGSNYSAITRIVSLYNNEEEHFCDLEFEYLYNSNLTEDENGKINFNDLKSHIKNKYPDVCSFSFDDSNILHNLI